MPATINNFSTWITIGGQETECYATEYSEDGKTVTCWIASAAGQNFAINWRDSTRTTSTAACITLDGVQVKGGYLESVAEQPNPRYCNVVTKAHTRLSSTSVRPFMFSGIQLTDDEDACQSNAEVQKIGNIEVVIKRARILGNIREFGGIHDPGNIGSGKIHERVKKGSVHRVSFGAETRDRFVGVRCERYEALAKFVFKYTSYDLLRANGIISNTLGSDSGLPVKVEPPPIAALASIGSGLFSMEPDGGSMDTLVTSSSTLSVKRERDDDEMLFDSDTQVSPSPAVIKGKRPSPSFAAEKTRKHPSDAFVSR